MPVRNDEIAHEQEPTGAPWEASKPRSFNTSVYLPCLKLSVTCGSFILYKHRGRIQQDSPTQVGRIIDVVSSINMVPQSDTCPAIQEPFQGGGTTFNDMPVQFIKVNVFKNCSLLSNRSVLGDDATLWSTTTSGDSNHGWKVVVQCDEYVWILADAIIDLAFVFMEEDVTSHLYDDCQGMCNFYVLKHRLSRNGCVSLVPRGACPPFPGRIEEFHQYWSMDHCQLIFNSIRQIGRAMQRLMCSSSIQQSQQGGIATRDAKLQLPSCSWFYIKYKMKQLLAGMDVVPTVRFSQPQPILSWGLTYRCIRQSGELEVLRFDTAIKMAAFREVFGHISGYGVQKKRPSYSEPREFLNMNDVVNIVCCNETKDDDDQDSIMNANDDVGRPFQRFGVMNDGIDLLYDGNDGILQVVVRYRKLVVSNQSLPLLRNVGVVGLHDVSENRGNDTLTTAAIIPGMEFMDDGYLMRITSVTGTAIRARKTYQVVDNRTTILQAADCTEITYTNINDVKNRIQEMLE